MEKTSTASTAQSIEPSRLSTELKREETPVSRPDPLVPPPAEPPAEVLFVDQQLVKDLTCGICLQIITEPRQCPNGHLFCYECLQRSILATSACPTCRCKLTEETISRSLIADKALRSSIVWCKYHFRQVGTDWREAPDGCKSTFEREKVWNHEKSCPEALISCSYSKECGFLRRGQLAAHLLICPFRPVECKFCRNSVQSQNMDSHLSKCLENVISCQWCGEQMKRKSESHHLLVQCPKKPVECAFRSAGCTSEAMPREQLEEHNKQYCHLHLSLLQSSFDDKMTQLRTDFTSLLKERDEKIESLHKDLAHNELRIVWDVKDWRGVSQSQYTSSRRFSFAGFQWYLGMYPNGDPDVPEGRGFLSIYLFLDKSAGLDAISNKSVILSFSIKIINFKTPSETIMRVLESRFPIPTGEGWGDSQIAAASSMNEKTGFVKNNSVRVEVSIFVKRTTVYV